MAVYLVGTGTRAGSGTIAITDSGGIWTASGACAFNRGFSWSATFYTASGVRRCTLVLSGSATGAGTYDFDTTGIPLTGTFSFSFPVTNLADIGRRAYSDIASAYTEQSGAAACSLTIMGYTMTITNDLTGNRLGPGWVIRSRCEATSPGSGSQTVSWSAPPGTCTVPATSVSATGSGVVISGSDTYGYSSSASTSATSAVSSISKTVSGAQNGPLLHAEAVAISGQDRDATLSGRLNRLMATWGDPIQWRVHPSAPWQASSDGDFSATIAQRNYDHYSTCWDHTVPSFQSQTDRETLNTHQMIQPQYTYVAGGLTSIDSLLIHGPQWTAMTLTHTATQAVDDGSSLTPSGDWSGVWTGQGGGSVAVVSGAIEVTGAASKAVRRTFTNSTKYTGWRSYSRLRIRLKCSAADHQITLRLEESIAPPYITDPTWTISTGAADTYTEHYIDLGAENNGPDLSIAGVGFIPGAPGQYFSNAYNPKQPDRLWLESLGAGTYSIDSITLSNHPDGVGGYTVPRLHVAMFSTARIAGIADGNDTYSGFSFPASSAAAPLWPISTLVANINNTSDPMYVGGWSASGGSASSNPSSEPWPASELTCDRHFSYMLGGMGLLWDGATQTWTTSFGTGGASPTGGYSSGSGIPAQFLVQQIEWDWPTALLGFLTLDGGSYHIGAGAVVGRSAWGRVLALGDSASPVGRDAVSGATVSLSTVAGVSLATVTTDADGFYSLPDVASAETYAKLTIAGRVVETSLNLHRTRIVATDAASSSGTLMGMAVSATQRVCRGIKDGSNLLSLEWWRLPNSWDATVTPLTLTGSACLAFDTSGVEARLWMAYEDASGIKTRYTENEGSSWSVAVTIVSAGTYPALAISPTSVRHYFWIDGATIKTAILDSQGAVVTAASTVVASGVAAGPIVAVCAGEEYLLTYKNSGGAIVSVRSTDNGITFS